MKERTQANEVIWYGGKILATVPITVSSKRVVKLMEEDYIELHFTLAEAVYFPVGAYCDDELLGRFYVTSEQLPKYDANTGGYSYELKMEAWYRTWKQKLFMLTAVSIEKGTEFRKEADWTLTNTLKEQMREVLVNLQLCGYVSKSVNFRGSDEDLGKYLSIDEEDIPAYSQSLTMSYSSVDILTALKNLADTWNCEWWVTGTEDAFVIHFGRCANGNAVKLTIGDNIETIDASDDTSDKGRKLFVFGGEENIPNTYRKELKFKMYNCYGARSFDAVSLTETDSMGKPAKIPFGATKDRYGIMTDGYLPYNSTVKLRLKGHGTSQRHEVKVDYSGKGLLYYQFKNKYPAITSSLVLAEGYRIAAEIELEGADGTRTIKITDTVAYETFQSLRETMQVTALRVVCDVILMRYDMEQWRVVDEYPYPLGREEWYSVTKRSPISNHLEHLGYGGYNPYAAFVLRDSGYRWTVDIPGKKNIGSALEVKGTPLPIPANPDFLDYVTYFDYLLTPVHPSRFYTTVDITTYAKTKWEGNESNDYDLSGINDDFGSYFDEYQCVIKADGIMTLYNWQRYAEESGLFAWDEERQVFILDPDGGGAEVLLSYNGKDLVGDWMKELHTFTDDIESIGTTWSDNVVYVSQETADIFRYYTEPPFSKASWELDITKIERPSGLNDNTRQSNALDRYHKADIIKCNNCGNYTVNRFSSITLSAPSQKPSVRVTIRKVRGATKAKISLTVQMGMEKYANYDFLNYDSITSNSRLYDETQSIFTSEDFAIFTFTWNVREMEMPSDFITYGIAEAALFLRAEVEYYDSDGKIIDLEEGDNISGKGYIEIIEETENKPTFQFVWVGTAYDITAKVCNFNSEANGRDFLIDSNVSTDSSFIYDGAEFILESDEDFRVPYKYYTSAIDDPSSIYSIGSKRLQLPVYSSEEFTLYKDKYNLSTVIDNGGNTWITRGDWAYRDGMIVPLANINDPNSKELLELCITKDEIYPTAKLLVKTVRTTDEQEKDEVEGESKADAVTWQWKQYHVTLMQPDGTDINFSQKYIRKNSDKLKLRFLVPEDVKEWADNGTLVCDFNTIRKNCKLAGMTFEDEFNDKIGEYTQDHALARNTDYSAKLPNDVLFPSVYDPVTLVNIDVRTLKSMKVVSAAEYSLLDYAFEYASALNDGNFTFECGMMSDFLDDYSVLGRNVAITHDALKQPKITRVIGYEMKLDIPFDSPTLTCGETEAYSRLKQLEKGVRKLTEKKITNNYYTSGLSRSDFGDGYTMVIDLAKGGTIAPKETETVTLTVLDALGNDVTADFTDISVARDSGDPPSDALWNAMHIQVGNPFELTFYDLNIDGINRTSADFVVRATDSSLTKEASNTMDFYI